MSASSAEQKFAILLRTIDMKQPSQKIYARPQYLPYTVLAPSISEVSRGVGDMDWVGARRWWRGGGSEVEPSPQRRLSPSGGAVLLTGGPLCLTLTGTACLPAGSWVQVRELSGSLVRRTAGMPE